MSPINFYALSNILSRTLRDAPAPGTSPCCVNAPPLWKPLQVALGSACCQSGASGSRPWPDPAFLRSRPLPDGKRGSDRNVTPTLRLPPGAHHLWAHPSAFPNPPFSLDLAVSLALWLLNTKS